MLVKLVMYLVAEHLHDTTTQHGKRISMQKSYEETSLANRPSKMRFALDLTPQVDKRGS